MMQKFKDGLKQNIMNDEAYCEAFQINNQFKDIIQEGVSTSQATNLSRNQPKSAQTLLCHLSKE